MSQRLHFLILAFLALLLKSPVDAQIARLGLLLRVHDLDGTILGPDWRKISASALMAVRHVNARNTSLVSDANSLLRPTLHLEYEAWDSKSDPSTGVAGAVQWTQSEVDVIIGAFRSAVSGPVSLVAQITQTPMLSYGSTAASLSNKVTYPSFSRVCPSDSLLALAIIRMCNKFRWSRIAVIYQDDSYGAGYAQDIDYFAGMNQVNVASSQKYQSGVEETIKSALQVTRDSGARIIVCITFDVDLAAIAKWAQEYGLVGKGYVYLTGDAISLDQNAHSREIRHFVKGWMRLASGPLYGARGDKFQDVWSREPKEPLLHPLLHAAAEDLGGGCDDYCAFMYDAVWAAAVGISRTLDLSGSEAVEDKAELLRQIRATDFEGATGRVSLEASTGDRSAEGMLVLVKNWVGVEEGGEERLVARDTWVWNPEEGLQRVVEDAPTWPGSWVTWDPPMDGTSCEAGMIYDGVLMACVSCPPGHEESDMACVPCQPGFIAPRAGMQSCEACQEGYANHSGMTECESCPPFSSRLPNSPGTSQAECQCEPTYYRPPGSASFECFECPPGAVCPGGSLLPYPRAGFWADRNCKQFGLGGELECEAWDSFLECNPSGNCAGGPDLECNEGRTGRMCLEAAPGWFIVGEEFWFRCGKSGHAITLAGIAAVVLCWIGIEILAGHNHTSTSTALLFVQVSTMIGTFGLRWHPYLQVVNTVFAIADFDVDFVQPYCLGPWSDVSGFYLQLLLPFIFTFVYTGYYALKKTLAGHRWADVRARLSETGMKKYIMFNITIYHTLCVKCFQTFRCEEFPDGVQYMKDSPTVQCWTSKHYGMLTTAVLYTVLIILGTPALLLWKTTVMQRDGTLHNPDNLRCWAFAHYSYEADFKWWEAMLLLRRLIVAVLAIALDSVPMMQGAITIVALTALLAAHVFAKPYISATVDILDFCSLCGTIMFVLVGLLMYPSITQGAQGLMCGDYGLEDFGSEYQAFNKVCSRERDLKTGVAIFAILILGATLLTAIVLAYWVVREELASKRAAHIIYKGLKRDQELATSVRATTEEPMPSVVSSKFPQNLLETANKVALEQILNGNKLLRWASGLRERVHSGPASRRPTTGTEGSMSILSKNPLNRGTSSKWNLGVATDSYMDVDSRVQALPEDVTQYSRASRARVLRYLCEIPGVVEYLAWKDDRGREGLDAFVAGMTRFAAAAEEDAMPFPITEIVKFEHRPLIVQMLLSNGAEGAQSFRSVMDAIFASNGVTARTEGRDCASRSGAPSPLLSRSGTRRQRPQTGRSTRDRLVPESDQLQGDMLIDDVAELASPSPLSVRAETLKTSKSTRSPASLGLPLPTRHGSKSEAHVLDLERRLMHKESSTNSNSFSIADHLTATEHPPDLRTDAAKPVPPSASFHSSISDDAAVASAHLHPFTSGTAAPSAAGTSFDAGDSGSASDAPPRTSPPQDTANLPLHSDVEFVPWTLSAGATPSDGAAAAVPEGAEGHHAQGFSAAHAKRPVLEPASVGEGVVRVAVAQPGASSDSAAWPPADEEPEIGYA